MSTLLKSSLESGVDPIFGPRTTNLHCGRSTSPVETEELLLSRYAIPLVAATSYETGTDAR